MHYVRSDDGGEFREGKFWNWCRERGIRQELNFANSPEFKDIAQRTLGLIETAGLVACVYTGFRAIRGGVTHLLLALFI